MNQISDFQIQSYFRFFVFSICRDSVIAVAVSLAARFLDPPLLSTPVTTVVNTLYDNVGLSL